MSEALSIVMEGKEAFDAALERWAERAARATAVAIGVAGKSVEDSARGKAHSHSGAMVGSITQEGPREVGFGSYELKVGPTIVYTRAVELGKKGYRHRPPHPWFQPGFEEAAARRFGDAFEKAWRGAMP